MFVHFPPTAVALTAVAGGSSNRAGAAVEIRMLGGFDVLHEGRTVTPTGRPAKLLKVVALHAGGIHSEQLIEALWPGAPLDQGRRRLRTTLGRLRQSCGAVVVRDGDILALGPDVAVDAASFQAEGEACLRDAAAPDAAPRAGALLGEYRGDLLPGDPYEPWAAAPRERLRRIFVRLHDLLAADAERRGDVEDAVQWLEQAIDAEPYDDGRYLRAARLLLDRGHHAHASRILERACKRLDELGLQPSQAFLDLKQRLRR